ncbi:Na+/H+ antiporter NhaC family protein [Paramaledivibacter caminithermalis]|uniref:Transporter, NhaC family (TC 2.A.35) n=1 Tax=Paramaledivibacter caminithermalis (strain DSM 15212 / CIP 107654 / DViRD3) TaxID=1121301 RepID=A0A1M6Q4R7_PARC5|nr:Na+/H+ antiporter NhaC family protein [Paramaledivibacter caminithermalis]SHK15108.1 transporter, NhaC family (TC 2.A.35) [Paramaledivibacter caminithermalis DSM 15212]
MNYGWLSVLPPILAIILSLLTGEVLLSLFLAILIGATIVSGNPLSGFTSTLNKYIVSSLTDEWNISILIFCLSIGGLIGLLSKNGGTKGIANLIVSKAKGNKSTLFMTWLLGVLIFFDDYANSLIVGNTMRSIIDKKKIAREKLAYIVDSTAAPVSSIALISTWVGFETGLIRDSLVKLGLDLNPYKLFIETIPYRFYSLLALAFVLIIIATGKDFGPMLKAEKRTKLTGKLYDDNANPIVSDEVSTLVSSDIEGKWYNAVIPILSVIIITIIGLYINGGGLKGATIQEAFGNADASVVLLWSSFGGTIIAALMSLAQRLLSLKEIMESWVTGVKSMTIAGLILVLAWSLGGVNDDLGTAKFIVGLAKGNLPPSLLPLLMFILPCLVAFSTGSSWGANTIVMPLAIPLAVEIGGTYLLVPVVGAVLTGAVFGDHCSPVSDTTIMSSMASACDHIAHVKTQLPYALTVAVVSIIVGFIPAGLGLNPFISLVLGGGLLMGFLYKFGKKVDNSTVDNSSKI